VTFVRGGSARAKTLAAGVCVCVALAACGGGTKKSAVSAPSSTTAVSNGTESSSTTAGPQATSPTEATTTSVASHAAATTPKTSVSTTKNKTAVTAANKVAPIGASVINVTTTASTAPPSDIQPGGTITKLAATDPTTLDSVGESNVQPDSPLDFAIYDTLMYDGLDGSVVPQTADSLTSNDGTVWTLKVHPNIKFSDGTPYDAAAVKFHWDRIADPTNASPQATAVKNIAAEEVLDAATLRITLKSKDSQFPRTVVNIGFIASPAAVQAQGKNFGANPVGAGPFVLKSWVRQSQMVLQRNPAYWRSPMPYVDQVVVKVIGDEQQRLDTFKAGGGNEIYVTTPESADQIVKAGGQGMGIFLSGGPALYFATDKPPLDDLRVRQAIYAAIDLTQLTKTLHGSLLTPLDSVFVPTSPLYDKSQLQPGYDPTKAQQLVDAVYASNGNQDITFTLLAFNQQYYLSMAQFVAASLNKLNHVKVTIDSQTVQTAVARVNQRAYQVSTFASAFNDPDPKWVNTFISAASPSPTGWKNSVFDAAVTDAKTTLDPNKRIADFREALRQFYTDMPAMFVEHGTYYVYGSQGLQNVTMTGQQMDLLDRMWIKSH
jgi:peptide/nickel transport system substrate-binding protein